MFLLRCNKPAFAEILAQATPNKLLQRKIITIDFFKQCISHLNSSDINIVTNTQNLLSTFLQSIFSKKFLSKSSDLIALLGGYEQIDQVFFDFLDKLSSIISGSIPASNDMPPEVFEQQLLVARVNSIRIATIAAGGSLNTSLETYFMSRDMFASIVSFINSPSADVYIGDAFSLIGILAAYGKLETHNPYRVRLADFIDHQSMLKTVRASGHVWQICLAQYQNKLENTGYFTGAIASPYAVASSIASWLGISKANGSETKTDSSLPPQQNATNEETNKLKYPLEIMSLTLATYEAVSANKVYAKILLECPATPIDVKSDSNKNPSPAASALDNRVPPFAAFISLCTYLFQNQHKSTRAALYARLCLLILHTIIETPIFITSTASVSAPSLLVDDGLRTKSIVVAQQRAPHLPTVSFPASASSSKPLDTKTPIENVDLDERVRQSTKDASSGRLLLEGILDALQCALRYNMKNNMDAKMYELTLTNVFQIIHFLRQSKFRLQYHWQELWKTLFSLIRFINSHSNSKSGKADSKTESVRAGDPAYSDLASLVVLILATCLIHGDTFLGHSSDYDDLFYKIIENNEVLAKLKNLFYDALSNVPSMAVLQASINHYSALFSSNGKNAPSKKQLSAQEVTAVIREGYQSLSLYQYATGASGSNPSANGANSGLNGKHSSLSTKTGAGSNGQGITESLRSPSDVAAYLMYSPLPKLREPDERSYFKKLMRQIIEDIQDLHSSI